MIVAKHKWIKKRQHTPDWFVLSKNYSQIYPLLSSSIYRRQLSLNWLTYKSRPLNILFKQIKGIRPCFPFLNINAADVLHELLETVPCHQTLLLLQGGNLCCSKRTIRTALSFVKKIIISKINKKTQVALNSYLKWLIDIDCEVPRVENKDADR